LDAAKLTVAPGRYSPLLLAYMGDAVFETLARQTAINRGMAPVAKLHGRSAGIVNARAQAAVYRRLLAAADEEEAAVLKRGRNARPAHAAKNASVSDYRHATGVEALFGYLFLTGRTERMEELFTLCLENDK